MDIFITGANRGIGAAMHRQLGARGETVTGTAREPQGDLVAADVTDAASLQNALSQVDGLDLLICNAGVYLDKGHEIGNGYAPDDWARTFATNVTGVYLTIEAALPALRTRGGKIAIISSQMGSSARAGGNGLIYRASKAAALNLGRNLAVALEPDGIAVGIYHPGWVRTDMGGSNADISEEESATGLISRFDALSMDTTGCFEMWNGTEMPF
ncbi:NADP-dependent 3-hydroxy acid dehydrogenase YdfG [Litoreibacter ponti]|uniref:NADP-dependent 3-hydroxy acid dehydrogenase YdfG n=1 Tax=Litoreibacter ponti TaxID=1510457 RepID=A0A2T6BLL7_9RHOB|nr:SDR family NAD(P)-dependent oxidoreductase [Litoreibacter ponti]PTX56949.1 NADP-dependent 3-hydroxy acid dehydrogenase YdfG [Litoreibacter ponti]